MKNTLTGRMPSSRVSDMSNLPDTNSTASAFMDFDDFHQHWLSAATLTPSLMEEAVNLAERLVAETDATGQGREYALIGALAHIEQVRGSSNESDEALAEAADVLVSQMNALCNA